MNKDNIDIFNDTLDFIASNDVLSMGINQSIKMTKVYSPNEYPHIDESKQKDGKIIISRKRSFQAAMDKHRQYPNKRIGVLNFASATNPGGGVTHGSSAQEESLCRCSTLYPVLTNDELFKKYYQPNRIKKDNLHDDAVIYTPDILICKNDEKYPRRLTEKDFVTIDILSCAAPNLREKPNNMYNLDGDHKTTVTDEELYDIHLQRARHILHIAKYHNIDILILGAFGCGAFRNNPYVVAKAYRDVLKEFPNVFDIIEFAIYCSPYDSENYDAFCNIISE